MSVENLDSLIEKTIGKEPKGYDNEWFLPPNPFRCIIVGTTGVGKTNLVLNMLLKFLKYDKLIVVAKQLDEHKYEFLKTIFEDMVEKMNAGRSPQQPKVELKDIYEAHNSLDDLPSVDAFKKDDGTKVIVFDDLISEKNQKKIEEHYTRGRKKIITEIYLAHGYSEVPKMIRKMADVYIFYAQKAGDRRSIHKDLVSGDMDMPTFHEVMKVCTTDSRSFLMMNRRLPPQIRYRKGFDEFLNIADTD